MSATDIFDVLLAVLGGAIRVGTPFLFVSLGECLTEKSGRINLGLEGVLVFSAMAGFGGAYLSGSVWLGVPDASVLVLQGFAFLLILASEALRGRLFAARAPVPLPPPAAPLPAVIKANI